MKEGGRRHGFCSDSLKENGLTIMKDNNMMMRSNFVPWDRCFICSSPVSPDTPTQNKLLYNPDRCKVHLFKYLLEDPDLSKQLSDDVIQFVGGGTGSQTSSNCCTQICAFCEKLADSIMDLQLGLEALQMKLVNHLVTLKKAVIDNSRVYGRNSGVKEDFDKYEANLAIREQGGLNCDRERCFLEVIHKFQTFVFENDNNDSLVPLVYLEKYIGNKLLPTTVDVTRSEIIKEEPNYIETWESDDNDCFDTTDYFDETQDSSDSCLSPDPEPQSGKRRAAKAAIKLIRNIDVTDDGPVRKRGRPSNSNANPTYQFKRQVVEPTRTRRRKSKVSGRLRGKSVVRRSNAARKLRMQLYNQSLQEGKVTRRVIGNTNRIWECENCPYKTRDTFNMEYHLRNHETPEKNYECPDCDHAFTQKLYLEVHLLDHIRTKKCDVCDERVVRFHLKEHLKLHGSKVYSCEFCGYNYGIFKNYVTHVALHVGAKLKCDLCPHSDSELTMYSAKTEFPRHLFQCHGMKEFEIRCEFAGCTYRNFDISGLKQHINNVHLNTFMCEPCNKTFSSLQKLNYHKNKIHEDVLPQTIVKLEPISGTENETKLNEEKSLKLSDNSKESEITTNKPPQANKGTLKNGAPRKRLPKIPVPLLKCEQCVYQVKESFNLEYHLKSHESSTKNYRCPHCKRRFTNKQYFDLHLEGHIRYKLCDTCGVKIIRLEMKEHLNTHGDTVYSCECCDNCFGTLRSFVNHVGLHVDARLKCPVCSKDELVNYSCRKELPRHLYEGHGCAELGIQCKEPDCSEVCVGEYDLREHIRTTHNATLSCKACFKRMRTRKQLDAHFRFFHPEKVVDYLHCDACTEKFLTEKKLNRHKMQVHDMPKFECELCPGKQWCSYDGIRLHRRSVHGMGKELPTHNCNECSRTFKSMSHLHKHKAVHVTTKDFFCEVCGFATKTEYLLRRHSEIHDERAKRHGCPHCEKRFVRKCHLTLHLRVHTAERPYKCDPCGMAFINSSNLNTHLKTRRHQARAQKKKDHQEDGEVKEEDSSSSSEEQEDEESQ